jgi:O-antigen/teichoic acid export membrane protein
VNPVLRSAAARLATFVPVTLATLVMTRVIIGHYGIAAFSAFALALALINLIPLNGLGVGAAITTAFATDGPASEHAQRVTRTAARVLAVSSAATILISAAITSAGLWGDLLGKAAGPGRYYGLAVAIYALSYVPGLAMSMLLGAHRNHVAVVAQSLSTPLSLVLVVIATLSGAPAGVLVLVPPTAVSLVNLYAAVQSRRDVAWWPLLRSLPDRAAHPGASIRATSGPMLLITLLSPISYQLDRIILSHLTSTDSVAAYSLTMQLFLPAQALITALAVPLWPVFSAARAQGQPGPSLRRLTALFLTGGALAGACLVAVSHLVARVVSSGRVDIGWQLPIAAGFAIAAFATTSPITSSIMDPRGLRVLAWYNIFGVVVNVSLSIILTRPLGAAGPIWATLVFLVVPTGPLYVYARNRQRSAGTLPDMADGSAPAAEESAQA